MDQCEKIQHAFRDRTFNSKLRPDNRAYLNSGHSKHRRTHERKQSYVNKENVALPDDLRSVIIDSSEKEELNDRYTSPSVRGHLSGDRGKELLTITVEIGNGQKENIIIFENDDAQQISNEFCRKHSINDELKVIFTNQIAENIIQVKEEIAQEKNKEKVEKFKVDREDSYRNSSPPSIEQPLFSSDLQ